jgi:hypothetical protein
MLGRIDETGFFQNFLKLLGINVVDFAEFFQTDALIPELHVHCGVKNEGIHVLVIVESHIDVLSGFRPFFIIITCRLLLRPGI